MQIILGETLGITPYQPKPEKVESPAHAYDGRWLVGALGVFGAEIDENEYAILMGTADRRVESSEYGVTRDFARFRLDELIKIAKPKEKKALDHLQTLMTNNVVELRPGISRVADERDKIQA